MHMLQILTDEITHANRLNFVQILKKLNNHLYIKVKIVNIHVDYHLLIMNISIHND